MKVLITPKKGRGLFASRPILKGELLIAEKAIATGTDQNLIQKCCDLSEIQGIEAKRISYLFDGISDPKS